MKLGLDLHGNQGSIHQTLRLRQQLTVTIAEVQSAINIILRLKAVDVCVDIDSSGSVSIAEVQKVINSFLGL